MNSKSRLKLGYTKSICIVCFFYTLSKTKHVYLLIKNEI